MPSFAVVVGTLVFSVAACERLGTHHEPASASGATVTGPISGGQHGWAFGAYYGDIGQLGYVEEEYFIEGEATRYTPVGELGLDGHWTVQPATKAPYKTRILVRRPTDSAKFNGTVVVEWANVSSGYEISLADPPGLYGDGFAYVAVSAQRDGIAGFPSDPKGLVAWDPERYGSLSVPDDGLSFDIFTQAARAVGPDRSPAGADPMSGLEVRKLIAVGASQSGTRVLAYANAIQPIENVFQAIMPVVCAGTAADFDTARAHPDPGAEQRGHSRALHTKVHDDLTIPVIELNTETEAFYYYAFQARQPDTPLFRYWEIAGASHGPTAQMTLIRQKTDRDGVSTPGGSDRRLSDVTWLPTLDAAFRHVNRWISGGDLPPQQPLMEMSMENRDVRRDEHGNAVGGIRLPEVEVPIARYAGFGPDGAIGGLSEPFSAEKLRSLYPTHESYVERVEAAAAAAERAGVILPYRVKEYVEAARAARIPA